MNQTIVCNHLTKVYQGVPALSDLNIALGEGRIVGLLGPNGSGKTTLLKLLTGLLTPESGSMSICGRPVGLETKSLVSYLPDHDFLTPWMSAEGMMDYFADFYPDFRREMAEELLRDLGVDPKQQIKTMSKGAREKVTLILAMSRRARVYLLDEPIAAVDPAARDYVLRTILKGRHEMGTILISTHLIADVEPILDDVIFLDRGVVRLVGPAEEVRRANDMSVDQLFREVFKC